MAFINKIKFLIQLFDSFYAMEQKTYAVRLLSLGSVFPPRAPFSNSNLRTHFRFKLFENSLVHRQVGALSDL